MNIKLHLHDGTMIEDTVEGFILKTFIEQINTDQHKMIEFGSVGVMKNTIKMVDARQDVTPV